jgi:sugar lactone lactonase YvrE
LFLFGLFITNTQAAVGDIYVSEDNGNIERFTPDGTESTFATGLGDVQGMAVDPLGNVFAADRSTGTIYKFTPGGTRTTFASGFGGENTLWGIALDSQGNLFAATAFGANSGILKFAPDGTYTPYAIGFGLLLGLAVDNAENVYVSGRLLGVIPFQAYKITPTGTISVLGTAHAEGLAVDLFGNLFASRNPGLVEFTSSGTVVNFATLPESPSGLAFDGSGNLVAALHSSDEILKVAPDGSYTTFATGLTSLPEAIAIQVPEPSMFALWGLCGAMLVVARTRLKQRKPWRPLCR